MTGIERLRDLAWARVVDNGSSKTLHNELISIADQIERERAEEIRREYEARCDWQKRCVLMETSVVMALRDMERHVSGVEGMEDSPVARWARELREALGTTMSRQEGDGVAADELLALSGQLNSAQLDASRLTHRAPVLAADDEPLEAGQTVWHEDGTELKVLGFGDEEDSETIVRVEYVSGPTRWGEVRSLSITHAKPEPPDSAERIAEDIKRMAEEWCSHPTLREASEMAANAVGEATMGVALSNLSKRCRALAEREGGE